MTVAAYRDHPVRGLLARLVEMQAAPEFSEPRIADNETYAFARDKVFAMAQAVQALLAATPAELTSVPALSQLQGAVQGPVNELTSYLANKNVGHIANAAAQFEQSVLPHLWGLLPKAQSLAPEAIASLLEAQAASSRETIRQLSAQRDELSKRLGELTAKADEQSARLEGLAEGASKERAEAAAAVAKLEQAFAEKEKDRTTIFESTLNDVCMDFRSFETTARDESTKLISFLEGQRDQAARLVQVVGNIGVTGNYQQIANAEAKQANFWRWATVLVFAGGISVAGATFIKFWHEPLNPENLWSVAIRLLYAIAITAPAWYTARESARHRSNSDRARQTELELASIGPFIELLPEDKKVQIREQLTAHYFGKAVDAHTVTHPLDANALKDLVVELAKAMKK